MAKRGRVLRDPSVGAGLLMVEGQQYPFALEGVWKSEAAPKPGLAVDVEFDASGRVAGIAVVPESQIAKEQAEVALKAAKEKGGQIFGQIVAKVGMANLVAGLVLPISWWFLTAVSIQLPFAGKLEFTFWQALGFLNANNILEVMERNGHPSTGIYGFVALVCMLAPFVQYFWKDKRAALGALLPLVFMVIVGITIRSSINSAIGGGIGGTYGEIPREAQDEISKAISIGMGIYLSVLASLYFAVAGLKNYLKAKACEGPMVVQKAAA
jgi:hypothetical protein